MSVSATEPAMVEKYGRHLMLAAEPTALLWLGTTAALTLGDGRLCWIADNEDAQAVALHDGAILSACLHPGGSQIVTGGDDGRVCLTSASGAGAEIDRFERKWIEHLVASPASGLIVASIGKEAVVWTNGMTVPSHRHAVPSTIGGLAFDGKGKRLAVSHYNGASLFFAANPDSRRTTLNWAGSHLACTMSRDGRYLLTALQETGLHGWQMPEQRDMQMSGYTAKTRSFSWSRKGKWLATSGDFRAILWPFEGKTGPMGKPPMMLAERRDALVTQVAFHPVDDILAVGYNDGVVALARLADDHTLLIDKGGANVTVLQWNAAGSRLGWGCEDGRIGILNLEASA